MQNIINNHKGEGDIVTGDKIINNFYKNNVWIIFVIVLILILFKCVDKFEKDKKVDENNKKKDKNLNKIKEFKKVLTSKDWYLGYASWDFDEDDNLQTIGCPGGCHYEIKINEKDSLVLILYNVNQIKESFIIDTFCDNFIKTNKNMNFEPN